MIVNGQKLVLNLPIDVDKLQEDVARMSLLKFEGNDVTLVFTGSGCRVAHPILWPLFLGDRHRRGYKSAQETSDISGFWNLDWFVVEPSLGR